MRGSLTVAETARDALFAVRGTVADLGARARTILFQRGFSADSLVRDRVTAILTRVRRDGDIALRALARELDGVDLAELGTARRVSRALDALDPTPTRHGRAAETTSHGFTALCREHNRGRVGTWYHRRTTTRPAERAGVYAPADAAYRAQSLWASFRARGRRTRDRPVLSPPTRETGNLPPNVVLAAAALTGVDRVFAAGGAGAIAAMAYGTEMIPRVDRIVGPGNAYVAEAKLQVASVVRTDAPAGPSELLVIADASGSQVIARGCWRRQSTTLTHASSARRRRKGCHV